MGKVLIGLKAPEIFYSISSNIDTSFNLYNTLISTYPVIALQKVIVKVTIDPEIRVRNFDEGSGWAAGTIIEIWLNNAVIYGKGGDGLPAETPGTAGVGSPALVLRAQTRIRNDGYILGGGGGSAGGSQELGGFSERPRGGGGGGGAGGGAGGAGNLPPTGTYYDGTNSGAGTSGGLPMFLYGVWTNVTGTAAARGIGGNGGKARNGVFDPYYYGGKGSDSGSWGENGASGRRGNGQINDNGPEWTSTVGGAGGNAITRNGHALTFLSGNNNTQIRGNVI